MGKVTGIEWTAHSWSPWEGCQQVGPGCDHCYALAMNRRWAAKGSAPEGGWAKGEGPNWGPHAPRRRTSAASWARVKAWDRAAAKAGVRRTVFPSICDPFDNAVPAEWRADFFDLMRSTPNLVWLLLTKRPGNVVDLFARSLPPPDDKRAAALAEAWPPNAALGCTVVNQAEADRDVPVLLRAGSIVKPAFTFLSVEPMLGPVDLTRCSTMLFRGAEVLDGLTGLARGMFGDGERKVVEGLGQVICGGESGPEARPMHPDWARGLRDQCAAADVPFLFKQWGEWAGGGRRQLVTGVDEAEWLASGRPEFLVKGRGRWLLAGDDLRVGTLADVIERIGKKAAGRLLDGVLHDARPAALTREAADA